MAAKRKIEIFSAGCPACEETIAAIRKAACPSCDVVVLDMKTIEVAKRAKALGIRSVPKMLEGLNRLRVIHPRLVVLGVLMTMVQHDMPESRESVNALRQILPQDLVLRTMVPRDGLFVKASARGLPVGVLEDGAGALAVFDALRAEIESKLERAGHPSLRRDGSA